MVEDYKRAYKRMEEDPFPQKMELSFAEKGERKTLFFEKVTWKIGGEEKGLRYGENPGQPAALYRLVNGNLVLGEIETIQPGRFLASDMELLQSGKHPGKTNITDVDNALNILRYFQDKPTVVIVKHNNPCGVARASTLEEAYIKAYYADRVAAFGGAIAFNRILDRETAEALIPHYAEVLAAPEFEERVVKILSRRPNLRVIRIRNMAKLKEFVGVDFLDIKSLIDGGIIVQKSFTPKARFRKDLKLAEAEYKGMVYRIQRAPTDQEYEDLIFGWLVESGVTSNSVIYVKDEVTVGIGTGEQDRVGVAQIARDKAYRKLADRISFERYGIPYVNLADGDRKRAVDEEVAEMRGGLKGAVMVSDAFFPFRDGVDVGIREGITAIIQPGGSERDFESIEACNEAGVTMVFTGQRSFKH